jgi:hypothetical protein
MKKTLIAPLAGRPDWYRVEDDTVVTHKKAGNAVSLFGDDGWDVRGYTTGTRRSHIYFRGHTPDGVSRALSEATTRQWKQVMYFLMYEATDTVPASSTLKASSICLKDFTFFAAARQLTLYEGLSSVAVVLDYVAQAGRERKAHRFHSILVKLHRLGVGTTGLRVPLAQLHEPLLERFAQRAGYAQYPAIPTRIYQHFLSACEHDLGLAEGIADILSDYLARVYGGESPTIPAELAGTALHFGCKDSPYVVSSLVASTRALCQLVILSFTGMRATEAENLPYDCLSEKPRGLSDSADPPSRRHSFCCETCRRRTTPASVRFLGRRVYTGTVVVLVSAMDEGVTNRRIEELGGVLGVHRRTLQRWRHWWRTVFAATPFWSTARANQLRARGHRVGRVNRFDQSGELWVRLLVSAWIWRRSLARRAHGVPRPTGVARA